MEPKAHHVIIGLFVVTALGCALVFALWLAKSSTDRDYSWYEVGFERAVSGLSEGNTVQYSGIAVGDVVNLRLDPADPRHVRALIRVYADVPIKKDTRAGLVLANITGSMSIQLRGGSPDAELLVGSRSNPPLIPADPSPFSMLLESGEELVIKFDQLLTNANALFSDDTIAVLKRTAVNLESITENLPEQQNEFSELMARFDETSLRVIETMDTWNALGLELDDTLQTRAPALLDSSESMLMALEATATRIDRITEANDASIDQGLQGLGELAPAMRELRATLRQLSRVAQRLEDNPADALLGREPIQEFNP